MFSIEVKGSRWSALRRTTTALLTAVLGCMVDVPARERVDLHDDRAAAESDGTTVAEVPLPQGMADVVVVVTLDGVRWQEVFVGVDADRAERAQLEPSSIVDAATLMPNLHWLIATRGAAIGAPGRGVISASGPNYVSLPGYMELFTGERGGACRDNGCMATLKETVADQLAVNGDPTRVAVFSSWPPLQRAATRERSRMILSAGRGGTNHQDLVLGDASDEMRSLFAAGEAAEPLPGYGGYRPDRDTAAIALRYLRRERPKFLFVGLGDTDEYGHKADYAGYLRALREADRFIGDIAITLQQLSDAGTSTLLVVTADHGRGEAFPHHGASHPESARSWLVAAGDAVRARGRIKSPAPRHLADITATIRGLAGLSATTPNAGTPLFELFAPARPLIASR